MKKFKHQCLIKLNNDFLIDELEKIGHTICICTKFENYGWLCASNSNGITYTVHGVYTSDIPDEFGISKEIMLEDMSHTHINCEKNVDLFLSIAAISDEDDYMQYFISTNSTDLHNDFFKCTEKTLNEYIIKHNQKENMSHMNLRKLTLNELINIFKK